MSPHNLEDLVLKKSKYNHIFSRDGVYAIYHAFFGKTIYLNDDSLKIYSLFDKNLQLKELYQINEQNKEEVKSLVENLFSNDFLVDSNYNENKLLTNFRAKALEEGVNLQMMYILPTDKCNLECSYCFIEEAFPKNYKFNNLNAEIVKKGIDIFFENSKPIKDEKRRIIFYGGEPTINKKIIREGVNYILSGKESDNTDISLLTNGTLIDSDFAKFIADNKIDVSISIDGPEEIHNKVRVYSNGLGTFEDIRKGYDELKKAGVDKINISFTVGSHNVNNLREHVEKVINIFDVKGMGFNFISGLPLKQNPCDVDIDFATEKVLDAFDLLREKGIYEDRIMRKLTPFVEGKFKLKDCGAIGNQIVLAPDGSIGPCHAFLHSRNYFNHHVNEGKINFKEDKVFKEWANRMPINMKSCENCSAIAICGGGCAYNAYLEKNSIWGLDDRMCKHNKKLLEWAIWETYGKIK